MLFPDRNPFDLLAELISYLRSQPGSFYTDYNYRSSVSCRTQDHPDASHLLFSFSELCDKDTLLWDGLSPDAYDAVMAWLRDTPSAPSVFSLLCCIDRTLFWEDIITAPFMQINLKDSFSSLNENAQAVGIYILPRVPSLHDPDNPADEVPERTGQSWCSRFLPGLNSELQNIYYVEKEQLSANGTRYDVSHHIYSPIAVRKRLRIALSPLSHSINPIPNFYTRQTADGAQALFSVQGLADPQHIRQRIKAAYRRAVEEKADILLFPELAGSADDLSPECPTSALLDEMQRECSDIGLGAPLLILLPTLWQEQQNTLHLFGESGARLCVQHKQFPFAHSHKGQDYLEDISRTQRRVEVLHIPFLGRITCPICVDFLHEEYRTLLLSALCSTLLLCPSWSVGKRPFADAGLHGIEFGCYTLWNNTCSAHFMQHGSLPEYTAIAAGPTDVSASPRILLKPACGGQCGTDASPCLFLLDLSEEDGHPTLCADPHICPSPASVGQNKEEPHE